MLNDLIDAKTAPLHAFSSRDPEQSAKLMALIDGEGGVSVAALHNPPGDLMQVHAGPP